jgi:hypothetical protein
VGGRIRPFVALLGPPRTTFAPHFLTVFGRRAVDPFVLCVRVIHPNAPTSDSLPLCAEGQGVAVELKGRSISMAARRWWAQRRWLFTALATMRQGSEAWGTLRRLVRRSIELTQYLSDRTGSSVTDTASASVERLAH